MAKERRDSKNRLLGRGEYQKEDGRYMYRYVDTAGRARFVYSWTLTKSDRVPKGKPPGPCLRDLEKQIADDLHDEIDTYAAKIYTIDDYFEKYLSQKKKLKETTIHTYKKNYGVYLKDRIGYRRLSDIKYSDIKQCYNRILEEQGVSISTLSVIDSILKPVLKMAVRDDLIRKNPADGVYAEIAREWDERPIKKRALTVRQQNDLLDFLSANKIYHKWKNLFTVMLGTGCRIGEICGLTWDDCDFANNIIHIRRTLCHTQDNTTGKYKLIMQSPKSSAGQRDIPMFSDVRAALERERKFQIQHGFCLDEIDGVFGFVFCNRNRHVLIMKNMNHVVDRIVEAYNKAEIKAAELDRREPSLLPKMSPHILRHTFCTRLCETGMNIKVVQEVMGHSKITMTMDVYDSVTIDFKTQSFQNVEGKIRVG